MDKDFWFPFEPSKWDFDVRFLSPAARGVWMQMKIEMWRSPKPGHLLQADCQPFARDLLATCCNTNPSIIESAIKEIESQGLFKRGAADIIFCPEIIERALLRQKRQSAGKKGGFAKSLAKPVARDLPAVCHDIVRVKDIAKDIIDTNVSIPASANAEPRARDNGFQCVRKADRWRLRIAALPPGLTLPQVQERLCCSYVRAQQLAKINGYNVAKTKRGARLRVTPKQWASTDWTLRDVDIARQLNISRERVRQVRKQRQAKPSNLVE